ncbi:phage tail terminator family protein [Gehongia tenuis]|uniref:Uncharacterized protein n=1 Tax=Gehongia tenuis TaxID=2763655 RepID=A0A926HNV9_9FIRM|nr:hypothetical protein [Gehongia tenuis]MBC8530568.1 hypothetical protein [Gehongia tenuis]
MVTEVIKAVAKALSEGWKLPVYGEQVVQGFMEPCFAIRLEQSGVKRELQGRSLWEVELDVMFFPGEGGNASAMAELPALHGALSEVSWEGVRYALARMDSALVDGVLHLILRYPFRALQERTPDTAMASFEVTVRQRQDEAGSAQAADGERT